MTTKTTTLYKPNQTGFFIVTLIALGICGIRIDLWALAKPYQQGRGGGPASGGTTATGGVAGTTSYGGTTNYGGATAIAGRPGH